MARSSNVRLNITPQHASTHNSTRLRATSNEDRRVMSSIRFPSKCLKFEIQPQSNALIGEKPRQPPFTMKLPHAKHVSVLPLVSAIFGTERSPRISAASRGAYSNKYTVSPNVKHYRSKFKDEMPVRSGISFSLLFRRCLKKKR